MAKFSVPYNADPTFVDIVLSDFSEHVTSFYGSLGLDKFGGGRAFDSSQVSTIGALKSLVHRLSEKGIEFNYVINSSNMMNRELLPDYRKQYIGFLETLKQSGISKVTLSNIFLMELTRETIPDYKVSASVNLKAKSIQEVCFLEQLGCTEITLHYDILKDVNALREIRSKTKIELKLIPNDIYIMGCPWQKGHTRMQGAHSREREFSTPYFSYYRNKCVNLRHYYPDEILKAMWISPDQLWRYESIGYSHFKLLDRLATTNWNVRVLQAYVERKSVDEMERILGTCGSVHSTGEPSGLLPSDSPYPEGKLEIIPSIQSSKSQYNELFDYFLHRSHPQECGSCRMCSDGSEDILDFPLAYREKAINNNRKWQATITKLPFIQSLVGISRRVKYE